MRRNSLKNAGSVLDEEFNKKMHIAHFFVKNLEDKQDAERAKKWLVRVSNIKSSDIEVKKNRNAFLSYFIKVLSDAVLPGCADDRRDTVCDPDNVLRFLHDPDANSSEESLEAAREDAAKSKEIRFHSKWSKDHRTYVAVKPLPGRGTLVFMAVSKKPGLHNWDLPPATKAKINQMAR